MSTNFDVKSLVRDRRLGRGWSQQELADRAGIPRPSVSAIEIERLVPSTAAALALAAALDCRVEDLFQLPQRPPAGPTWAWPLPTNGHRYWQADVAARTLLYPYESTQLGTIEHDGVVRQGRPQPRTATPPPTLVMACCDPAVGLLAGALARSAGIRVLAFFRPSRQALALLKQGLVHVAGTHLCHHGDQGNVAAVQAELGAGYSLLRVAEWEAGVATAGSRPASLRALIKSKPRWIAREPGSGARQCLDELLGAHPAPRRIARDHRGVVEAVRSGWADAGVCLRLSAAEAGLNFLAVRKEAYDLCYATQMQDEPRIRALCKVIQSASFHQLIDDLPGYRSLDSGSAVGV